jgi:hypothetical protein
MGRKIAKSLEGMQFCSTDYSSSKYDPICFYVRGFSYALNANRVKSPYEIPSFGLELMIETFGPGAGDKLLKGELSFEVELKNGYPVKLNMPFAHIGSKSIMLKETSDNQKFLNKIKNIRITKPANPCFVGWKFAPHYSSYAGGKMQVEDKQAFYKTIKGREVHIYKDMGDWSKGTGHIENPNGEYDGKPDQKINWTCSGGKLTITPVKDTSEGLDFSCLVRDGFKKTTMGGGATKATIYEKQIGSVLYQFATNMNQVSFYDVNKSSKVKVGKWKCDSSTTSPIKGVKIYDVTERMKTYD